MHTKQTRLWLLAALFAPIAHFSGCGWLSALLLSAAVLPLSLLPKCWTFPKPFALIQMVWLGIVAGNLLPASAAYWPSDNQTAVPLTLLTLAALTCAANAPRVGAVLAFCIGLLALPVAATAAAEVETAWLGPELGAWEPGLLLTLLLVSLPVGGNRNGRTLVLIAMMAAALATLVQGVISLPVALSLPDPFYQTARALGYMEPIAAVAMTLGWYAMATVLHGSAAEIAKSCGVGERLSYVLLWGTAATVIVMEWQLSATILNGFGAFLWVLSPFFQKLKKVKNSA